MFSAMKAAVLATAIGLVACGGGGGGGDSVAPPAAPSVKVFAGALQGPGSRDGAGAAAQFKQPEDVAQDGAGNVYVADTVNHTIRKITRQGVVTTLAGAAGQPGSADGVGSSARFLFPAGIAVTGDGTVYVSDTANSTLRRITSAGVVTTIAGAPGQAGDVDGPAATARFTGPRGLAVDQDGTLYVSANYAVRKLSPDGTVSTFAGKSGEQGRNSGNAAQTRFIYPVSVAVGGGNVYVAQGMNMTNLGGGDVRKFSPQGDALPFGPSSDGVVGVPYPVDIAADSQGNVYVASNGADQQGSFFTPYRWIEMLSADGRVSVIIAGADSRVGTLDGPGASARFVDPRALAIGPDGRIVVAEGISGAIRAIDPQAGRTVTTLAGGDGGGGVDGPAESARFNFPRGLAAAPDGTLYVADMFNRVVRKVSTGGSVSTLAPNFSGGGGFSLPEAVAVSAGGVVYVLEGSTSVGRQVWAIDAAGAASRFYTASANTQAIASDAMGNLYVSERGQVTVVAPGGGARVLTAEIFPQGLAVDAAGNVHFSSNLTVGVVDPSGRVNVRAGRAGEPGSADGSGLEARFSRSGALALDPAGNLYVADELKIRKVTPQAVVTTVADVSGLDGVQREGSPVSPLPGLAWTSGGLFGIVQNALIKLAPLN